MTQVKRLETEEDCKMEVDSDLDLRKREITKQLRKTSRVYFAELDDHFVKSQKEKWQQESQRIEQRRNDLLKDVTEAAELATPNAAV